MSTTTLDHIDMMDVARRTGLERLDGGSQESALPIFVHGPTRQEFTLVPAGRFAMGLNAEELVSALREVHFDPDIDVWREQHRHHYESANPVHGVSVQAFLCGRSPLLGRTVSSVDRSLKWSPHETAEHHGPTVAAAMTAADAEKVLKALGWELISEAQWEYVARCGGTQRWAETRANIDLLQCDPRYSGAASTCTPWGIWGLGLGEWMADEWHESYATAPSDGSPWRSRQGPPSSIRGGGVLHAPWQDSNEAMSCHASRRGGTGAGRKVFTARPIIALPWLHSSLPHAEVASYVPFDEAIAKLESELRAKAAERRHSDEARRARYQRLLTELPASFQKGTVRSVGGDGVYVVRLAEANAILRLGRDDPRLVPGTSVTVRIVGSGGVPDAELVAIHE